MRRGGTETVVSNMFGSSKVKKNNTKSDGAMKSVFFRKGSDAIIMGLQETSTTFPGL